MCIGQSSYAQTTQYAFRTYLNNKDSTHFSLNQPEQFLSQRSIERRIKYNIPIDSSDLPVCQDYLDGILSITGGVFHCRSKWQNSIVILLSDSNKIHLIDNLSFVKNSKLVAVYPNGLPKPARTTPQAEEKPTGFNRDYYGAAWKQISLCNGQFLHQNGATGKGVLIALIDAGFDGMHNGSAFDSLINNGRLIDRWNFVEDTILDNNEGSHGTDVLSCMAANLPDTFVGVAPNATYALYTSEDLHSEQPIEEDNWVAAAERADSLGADIITTSLGYNTFDPPFPDEVYSHFDGHSTFIAQGANIAFSKGILVFASAGNEGVTPWHYILTPGDADSAVTVGAVDSNNIPSSLSSFGPNASNQIKPDVVAMGVETAIINQGGNIERNTGTSFATPIIAGLSACLMQVDTTISPTQLKHLILFSSDFYDHPNNHRGYGLPDFSKAYNSLTDIGTVAENGGNLKVLIYPNPNNGDHLNILLPYPIKKPFKLIIRNLQGRIVWQKSFSYFLKNTLKITLPAFPPDMYFVEIDSENTIFKTKMIKSN